MNSDPVFSARVLEIIAADTGLPIRETEHHFVAQSMIDALVAASGSLRALAVALTKIANDVRWMSSGPNAGFGEIELPELQPGSSIMPGKVNPVAAESLLMVCAQVLGYDVTVGIAGQAGNFELNTMLPIHCLRSSPRNRASVGRVSGVCGQVRDRASIHEPRTGNGREGSHAGNCLGPCHWL